MKSDPLDDVNVTTYQAPPSQGPGSGKAAWVAFAESRMTNEQSLWGIIEDQSSTIRELQAEVELLRAQIAKRKPKGGRPRTDDKKVLSIEADLQAGLSKRETAKRNRVSPMTVVRVAQRVAARGAVTPS
jgi:hypothetical protein